MKKEKKIKIIQSIADKHRLNLIRSFAGEEALEQLDEALAVALDKGSKSLQLVTEFLTLLDSPKQDTTGTYPPYTTENRKVNIVQNTGELERAIKSIRKTNFIGFDSEQKPTFRKGETPHGVAVIQLANLSECYVIQVKKIKNLSSLFKLIEDDNIVKVGVNLTGDRHSLYTEFGVKMRATIDIDGVLSKLTSRDSIGAKKAATIFLKRDLQKSKKISTSNWEVKELSQKQVKYAAEDACVAYDVTIHLLKTYPFIKEAMPSWLTSKNILQKLK